MELQINIYKSESGTYIVTYKKDGKFRDGPEAKSVLALFK